MKKVSTKKLVFSAMSCALIFVASYAVKIPSPVSGYINLGDCFVLLSGWMLGPLYGAVTAGIGSAFADLLGGYTHYLPGTLIIKAADALAAALIFKMLKKRKLSLLISGIVGETVMTVGYFIYAYFFLGIGLAAIITIPENLIQGAFGIAIGILIMHHTKTYFGL